MDALKKNADGANRIIANNENCLVPSSRPFWKHIENIPDGVRTHSQHKRQKLVTRHKFETYFHNKNEEDIKRWTRAPDSEVRILKLSDRFYVI